MRRLSFSLVVLMVFVLSSLAEGRVGGGRSFGSRGSRSFGSPMGNAGRYRAAPPPPPSYSRSAQPQQPFSPQSVPHPSSQGSSFLKSMGAGIAGGMLGGLLARSLGWGGFGYAGGPGGMGG